MSAPPPGFALVVAFLVVGFGLLAFLRGTRRREGERPGARGDALVSRWVQLSFLSLVAVGLLLRFWLLHVWVVDVYEFEDLRGSLSDIFAGLAGANDLSGTIRFTGFHAPLTGILGELYTGALSLLGLSDTMVRVRGLLLVALAVSLWLVVRIADRLGAPLSGRLTALCLLFAPRFAVLGTTFIPFAFDMAFSLFFLDRVTCALRDRELGRDLDVAGLGLAAGLVVWCNYLSALLVVPVLGLLLLRAKAGRERGRLLLTCAASLLLVAPLLQEAAAATFNLVVASLGDVFGASSHSVMGEEAHGKMSADKEPLFRTALLPLKLIESFVDFGVMLVLAIGGVLVLRTRERPLLLASLLVLLLITVVGHVLITRPPNYASIVPMMVFLGLLGWERAAGSWSERRRALGALVLLLALFAASAQSVLRKPFPPVAFVVSWARGDATWFALVEKLHGPELGDEQLVVVDPRRVLNPDHLGCGGTESVTAMWECPEPFEYQKADRAPLEHRDRAFHLLVAREKDLYTEVPTPRACTRTFATPQAVLFHCPSD